MTDRIPAPSFRGWIESGDLVFDDPQAYADQIQKLEGERVSLTLKKFRKGRSLNQHRYYFACVGILAEFTGYDAEELHNGLKSRFLVRHEDEKITTIASTTRPAEAASSSD